MVVRLVWRASLGFPVGFLFVFSFSFVLAFTFEPCSFVDFHDLCASSLFGFQRRFFRFPLSTSCLPTFPGLSAIGQSVMVMCGIILKIQLRLAYTVLHFS